MAASNPCPCGFDGDRRRRCTCLPNRVVQYRQRLSGPLLDRIDIQLFVPRLTRRELMGSETGERSETVRGRVEDARARQRRRLAKTRWTCNAQMPGAMARRRSQLTVDAAELLASAVDSLALSGRGFDRAIRVARTIADIAGDGPVRPEHMSEALGYRVPANAELEERPAATGG
jgi:magnesium chelatase family protein